MKANILPISIFILSIVLYQAWVSVPMKRINFEKRTISKLKKDFDLCKHQSEILYNSGWLRQCHDIKPLDKECVEILEQDYPWEWYNQYKSHIEGYYSDTNLEGYNNYLSYEKERTKCSCRTLPEQNAKRIEERRNKETDSCLNEIEVLGKALKLGN